MNGPIVVASALVAALLCGCASLGGPPRSERLQAQVEEGRVRLLRKGLTVSVCRTEMPHIERWKLIEEERRLVVKSHGHHGPANVELFDTATGRLIDEVLAYAIRRDGPKWTRGFGE